MDLLPQPRRQLTATPTAPANVVSPWARNTATGRAHYAGRSPRSCGPPSKRCAGKLAAPGMCNPEDESPQVDGDPDLRERHAGSAHHQPNANTTPCSPPADRCCAQGNWARITGCRSPSSSPPRLDQLESGAGMAVTAIRHPGPDARRDPLGSRTPITTWRCSTGTPRSRSTSAAPAAPPPSGSGSCCTPPTAAAPSRAARCRATSAKPTTSMNGSTADPPTSTTSPSTAPPPQIPHQLRLENPQTPRRPHRMDPTTTIGHPTRTPRRGVNDYHHPERLLPNQDRVPSKRAWHDVAVTTARAIANLARSRTRYSMVG